MEQFEVTAEQFEVAAEQKHQLAQVDPAAVLAASAEWQGRLEVAAERMLPLSTNWLGFWLAMLLLLLSRVAMADEKGFLEWLLRLSTDSAEQLEHPIEHGYLPMK